MALPAVPFAPANPPSAAAAALLVVIGGSAAVFLVLYVLAVFADTVGVGLPGLPGALDPTGAGSLPGLWGTGWLGVAAVLAFATGLRVGDASLLRLALLPAVLGLAETSDLAARLEPGAAALFGVSSGLPAAKLLADGVTGGLVLVASLAAARGGTAGARLGRRCLVAMLVAGGASVACDLTVSALGVLCPATPVAGRVETIEETIELALCVLVAAAVLGTTLDIASDGDRHEV